MKACTLVIALSILVIGHDVRAQTPDPLSYFPHHQGDIWEYVDPFIPGSYEQNRILADTVLPDGRYMIETTLFGKNIVDTSAPTVRRTFNNVDTLLQYRLGAQQGERWVYYRHAGSTFFGTVISISSTVIFGHPVTVKQIDYTDSASSLLFDTDYLATMFGLIGQDADGFPYRRLRGAIINGVQYGTVTVAVPDPGPNLPITVSLFQNYPNPFNPSTEIVYEIPAEGRVELKVYDLLGREVRSIVSTRQAAGVYRTRFDASGLVGGVYLYRLTAGEQSVTMKMILLH